MKPISRVFIPPNHLGRFDNEGDVVVLKKYRIVKHTRCGKWISMGGYPEKKKFVLDDSVKRFAYESIESAKESFFARKRRQLGIKKAQIEMIELAVTAMKEGRIEDYRSSVYFD